METSARAAATQLVKNDFLLVDPDLRRWNALLAVLDYNDLNTTGERGLLTCDFGKIGMIYTLTEPLTT